jgi:hypothetical protein
MRAQAMQTASAGPAATITNSTAPTTSTSPLGPSRLRTSHDFLENYANCLQSDLADFYFDWLEMGHYCGYAWEKIKDRLEKFGSWDLEAINGQKPALEPATDILVRDTNYPMFLNAAFSEVLFVLTDQPWMNFGKYEENQVNANFCLVSPAQYHPATAAQLMCPGSPIQRKNFYTRWSNHKWEPKWNSLMNARALHLNKMYYDTVEEHMRDSPDSRIRVQEVVEHYLKITREMPEIQKQYDRVFRTCLMLGFVGPYMGKRAYAGYDEAMPDILQGEREMEELRAEHEQGDMEAGSDYED